MLLRGPGRKPGASLYTRKRLSLSVPWRAPQQVLMCHVNLKRSGVSRPCIPDATDIRRAFGSSVDVEALVKSAGNNHENGKATRSTSTQFPLSVHNNVTGGTW